MIFSHKVREFLFIKFIFVITGQSIGRDKIKEKQNKNFKSLQIIIVVININMNAWHRLNLRIKHLNKNNMQFK